MQESFLSLQNPLDVCHVNSVPFAKFNASAIVSWGGADLVLQLSAVPFYQTFHMRRLTSEEDSPGLSGRRLKLSERA